VIVRILGEGQLAVDDADIAGLNTFDDDLLRAVDSGDEASFVAALGALLARVRELGSPVADDEIVPSELILPSPDASLTEVKALLTDEGLIPG
jgi:hypothetical protein